MKSQKSIPMRIFHPKEKRSTEGCSKFKSPETRQVQERLNISIGKPRFGAIQNGVCMNFLVFSMERIIF